MLRSRPYMAEILRPDALRRTRHGVPPLTRPGPGDETNCNLLQWNVSSANDSVLPQKSRYSAKEYCGMRQNH